MVSEIILALCLLANLCQAQSGIATYYADDYHGNVMRCGGTFDMNDATITAANQWSCGTRLHVTSVESGESIVVTVQDTGAFSHELDLSRAAFERLAPISRGVIEVVIVDLGKVEDG